MRDMELESEFEFENQADPFLNELESEWETLGEGFRDHESLGEGPSHEFEAEGFGGQQFSLGEGESEWELEGSLGEFEGEQFFKKIRGLIKKAAPLLAKVAKVAAPMVGTAIGGPLGAKLGSMAANLLGESEYEYEFESEFEGESEAEFEAVMEGPLTEQQALGELMATAAANAQNEYEAEAQIGAATIIALSPQDRQALRNVLANINRGTAILTRMLRRNRVTAPFVRTVPTIVKRTAVTLKKQAAAGRPVTKKSAATAMARQTRKVLSSPQVCAKAMNRNVKATRAVSTRIQRVQRPSYAG
jgi:hypothetical protein